MGGSLFILAAAGIGREAARNYVRRPAELKDFLPALQVLETEIGFGLNPLPEAMRQAATATGGCAARVFAACAGALAAGDSPSAGFAWLQALGQALPGGHLNDEDRAALGSLAASLGASDARDQLKHLALCRERLKRLLAQAEDERERQARSWSYACTLIGVLVVLVLI